MLFNIFPAEDGPIAASWIGTCEVHRIRTARGGTLAEVTVGAHGHEHELTVEIVLPEEDLGFRNIGCETDIAGNAIA